MEKVIINEQNLKDNQMDKTSIKVRALLVLKKQVLIAYYGGAVLFPGGKPEKDETNKQGLIRELREETGITYNENELNDLFLLEYYQPNYPTRDHKILNRLCKTYFYYGLFKGIDDDNRNMTEIEKRDGFNLKLVDIDKINNDMCDKVNPRAEFFDRELVEAIKVYKRLL